MISKITQTFDFKKLKKKSKSVINKLGISMLVDDPAKVLKDRINKNVNYNGQAMRGLEKSTFNIRKMRGRTSSKPLIDTGKLINSIKTIKKKNKTGVRFLKYGMNQAEGFTTKNHFAVKKGNKVVGFRDYSDGRRSLPRPWIHPESPFAGLLKENEEASKAVVKAIRKAMKGKVTHRYNK